MDDKTKITKTKEKISIRRLLIIILFVLITVIVVNGLIWWRLNPIIESQNDSIHSLENQIKIISQKINDL